jgi:phosphopantothenoylcysteine decarboxylase/phosphopantothenate--cysteine ligase
MPPNDPDTVRPRLLITSGPTQEPIDAVRFIGNRSSGRLGAALADAAAGRGWDVTILAGSDSKRPTDPAVRIVPFRTTADLGARLAEEVPACDVLVMAAAVADYRPRAAEQDLATKRRRTGENLILELEPTPDLLAACARIRRPEQVFVGFALEPRAEMLASAAAKLERKKLDLIVANPLETMDAPTIEATLMGAPGTPFAQPRSPSTPVPKAEFADLLLDAVAQLVAARSAHV